MRIRIQNYLNYKKKCSFAVDHIPWEHLVQWPRQIDKSRSWVDGSDGLNILSKDPKKNLQDRRFHRKGQALAEAAQCSIESSLLRTDAERCDSKAVSDWAGMVVE
jgi:hypothetical protein